MNFTLGTLYFQIGSNSVAVEHYEAAIAKFPDFRRAHKNLGMVLVREGKYADAVKPLTRTIELGGGDGNTFGLLGFAYLNQNQYLPAETAYRTAMMFMPEVVDWKLGIVKCQVAQGRYSEATELLDELLQVNPNSDSLWSLQAGIYLQMDQPKKAAVNYELLRKMDKATAPNLMMLGDIYMTQNARDLALSAYLEAVEQEGTKNVGRALRAADILTSRGAWDEASVMFKKIREVHGASLENEDELKLLKLESKVTLASGNGEAAIAVLEKIIEKNPMDGEALLMAGDYYARNGLREKAEFRFEAAAKISGFTADAHVKHAQLLVQSQKYDRALELLQKAQKLKPRDNVERYYKAVERMVRGTSG